MNLVELNGRFSDEDKCREFLARLRWPEGVTCPKCKGRKVSNLRQYRRYECSDCQQQFTVTANTVFHDTHLPLEKWFLAVYLLTESRKGMSANQLKRMLGVSYKTAWYLCHRIRSAMIEMGRMLDGQVEVDETYVGGKPRRARFGRVRKPKQVVIGIRQRNGGLRLIRAADAQSKTVGAILRDHISEDVEVIFTDESAIYPYALTDAQKGIHKTICHQKEYVSGDVHTNTVESAFSLLKRGIIGTWHKVSVKHLPAYLDEMCFRFNRRKAPDLFLDTLRHMITSPVLTYERLTA